MEIVHFGLEIYSNTTWEVGEKGSFLDFNIKVYIHYSTAQTGAPLASSLAGFFRETGGSGDHTRAPAPARQSGPLPLHMAIFAPEKSKP